MNVLTQLIDFWSKLLYNVQYVSDDLYFEDTEIYNSLMQDFLIAGEPAPYNALGDGFKNFMYYFFAYLPHFLAFLTLALAVFLFCFMMYKIIKLFTNTI